MAVRTLDQVLSELNSVYAPQENLVRQKQALIPGQIAEEEKGLQAKQEQSFGEILGGARRRGLGFSGIPLQEQAKYTSTEFLPAMARLRQSGREQAMSLEEALLGLGERKNTLAQQLRQGDVDADFRERQHQESIRQFNAQLAAQQRQAAASRASAPRATFGNAAAGQAPKATIAQKQDGGFAFTDAKGAPISAARYAQLNNQDVRDVLYQMGSAGDNYSKQLYNQLSNDPFFGRGDANYDKRIFQAYSPIFWGAF